MSEDGLKPFLKILATGRALTVEETEAAFEVIMNGQASDAQIGGTLMAMRARGEAVSEIVGAAKIMRAKALKVMAPDNAIDCCGTGGDGSGSYNVSTAVALIVAACGVPVAKHGNRAASSRSGAADVLDRLGVNLEMPTEALEKALAEIGFAFLMAPRHHAAMRHVMPVRQQLGTRTLFNLLGPLSNPAGAKRQLMGVFAAELTAPIAEALAGLNCECAWVVHGDGGLDELSLSGASQVSELKDGKVRTYSILPEDAGVNRASLDEIKGGDPEHNAEALKVLLKGQKSAYRDIAVLNSAAALIVAGKASSLSEGGETAQAAIDSGAADNVLDRYIALAQAYRP